ncbi:pantothenate kinase domain protein, partial [Vibrio harveyi]
ICTFRLAKVVTLYFSSSSTRKNMLHPLLSALPAVWR